MANHKRKRPRKSPRKRSWDKYNKHELFDIIWIRSTPKWWNIVFNNQPKRRRNKRSCQKVLQGFDPDELVFDLGNCKPHLYYW